MHILFIYCHPGETSFCAAIRDTAIAAAQEAGHETTLLDLYGEHFDPVMHGTEWRGYNNAADLPPDLVRYIAAMMRADAMVFIYPTWWDGPPALLKGWLDRLWRPNFAFHNEALDLLPGMSNIRTLGVISTYGQPKPAWPFRRMAPTQRRFLDTLRPCVSRNATTFGLPMYEAESASPEARAHFLKRVRRLFARLG